VENSDWEWQEYPVIMLSFNEISNRTPELLEKSLSQNLLDIAGYYSVTLKSDILELQFKELIHELFQKTKRAVVVLIDEYDKPIIEHLGKGHQGLKTAKANRDILRSFFGVLKGITVSPHLRFVFLTGISRFSKVSIFSELNNLRDLSMKESYAEMLGYTQEELITCFDTFITQLMKKVGLSYEQVVHKLAQQYNGYRFSKKAVKVYNPFSILNVFSDLDFQDYWFKTATPTFLINVLKQFHYPLPEIEGIRVSEALFTTFEIERLQPEALLFQTGYLTIKGLQEKIYTLDYPNLEVKNAFLESLLFALAEEASSTISSHVFQLAGYLEHEDLPAFLETMKTIFASIPYTISTKRDEAYFHTIFYLMISASGADTDSELLTNRGRIDLVITFPDKVYIIEFKCNQRAKVAIRQILDRGYAEKYRRSGKRITLIGINFDSEKRNIAEWEMEKLDS